MPSLGFLALLSFHAVVRRRSPPSARERHFLDPSRCHALLVPMAGGGPDGRRWSRWPAVVPMAGGAPLVWAAGIFLARGRGAPCAAGTPLGQKPTPPPGASRGSPGTSPPAPAQVWSAPFAPRRVASRYFYLASRRPPPQRTPRRRRPCFARFNPPRGSARLSKRPRSGPKILISGSQNPRSLKKIEGRGLFKKAA